MRRYYSFTKLTLITYLVCFVVIAVSFPQKIAAVTAADWKPGRIIDDGLFTNAGSMSPEQIQAFLDARVPSCDTNGEKLTTRWNSSAGRYYTRAEWGAYLVSTGQRGNTAPFTCLKDFYEVPKTTPSPGQPLNNYGGKPIPAGAKSAAQIIYDAAQAYQISPKVLLVTIQKESYGPLTSDDWPFKYQYQYSMGAHCPDTAPCDPDYEGFSIQIYESARLFRYYLNNMGQAWWPYKRPYQNNYVLWNVASTSCGGSNVYIESAATAALYTYTPYQPNAAALANMTGTGDGCSAYGNRNFWRIFNDWFGTTNGINGNIVLSKSLTTNLPNTTIKDNVVTASFEIENKAPYDDYVGGIGICARINGEYYDFGFTHHQYIPANGKKTITFSKTLTIPGTLYMFTCSYHPEMGWASDYYPYSATTGITRTKTMTVKDNPLITSGLSITPASPSIGQEVTATFTVTNASATPINLGSLVVAGRDPSGRNVDFRLVNDAIVPANGTYTYTQKKIFGTPGSHSFYIARWKDVWSTDYPKTDGPEIIIKKSTLISE